SPSSHGRPRAAVSLSPPAGLSPAPRGALPWAPSPPIPPPMPARLPARLALLAHPATPDGPVHSLTVEVDHHADGGLRLSFALAHGGGLLLPAPQAPGPADGLWAHTCCEAFVAVAGETGYREYNFSPSGQWAS